MSLSDIFSQRKSRWDSLKKMRNQAGEEMLSCPKCKMEHTRKELSENSYICPECGHYFTVPVKERIEMLCDEGSFKELYANMKSSNPLNFPGYEKKLQGLREQTGNADAVVTGVGKIENCSVAIGIFDSTFLMGSMGTVVGEKIARLAEHAGKKKLPLIIFSASGGARMQEGLYSLMQMAKTAAAIEAYKNQGGLFVSVLTNPTTGGVSASFASLGDIMIAEPDALICFAGPRVIKQTIGQTLPKGFQHSEFLMEHGMLDLIVERRKMKQTLYTILRMHHCTKASTKIS